MSNRPQKPPAKQQILHRPNDLEREQKMLEALGESEDRYRFIFDDSPALYVLIDTDGIVQNINKAMLNSLGYSKHDVVGKHVLDFVVPQDVEKTATELAKALGNEKASEVEAGVYAGDGSVHTLLFPPNMATLRDTQGKLTGIIVAGVDITERKRMEKALENREAFLNGIIGALREAMLVVYDRDARHVNIWTDPELEKRYGIQAAALLGESPSSFLPPPEASERIAQIKRVFDTGEHIHAEFPVHFPAGDFWHDAIISPIQLPSGEITAVMALIRDATERKRSEETLRQSEERYRTILEEMEDNYYEVDLAGNFTFVNEATCRTLGYTRDELIGMNNRNYVAEEDAKTMFQDFHKVYLTGKPIKGLSYRVVRRDGTTGIGELAVYPLHNEEGETIGFRGIGRDVTERKQMEEATKEAEERYHALFDRSLEAVYLHDLEGNFVDANQVALDLLGYSREDIPSLNVASLLDEEQMPLALQGLEELTKTGAQRARSEYKLRRKDGKYVYVETDSSAIHKKGKHAVIQGIARDVTERKQMEEALQTAAEQWKATFDAMNDAVYLLDNECRIVRCNTALEKLLGKPSNEIIGHLCWEVVHCTPGPIEECPMLRMKQTLQRETTLRSVGNEHLELIADPVMDKDGSLVGAVHIIADISQRKQAEEERQQMEQKAQLASRLASVGELAAGIAHEINNPLTSVIGYAQLLSAEESIPADMKKDLKAIIDGANRVAGIVKRLLTFARQTKPQQTLVNVADLITATLELRAYHLRNNNIKVTTQFDPKLPIITADAGQLQQVFLNIIVNAETEVKRSRGKGKLLIKTEKIGKRIRVSFEDNGPGIDKENLKKIFDPFFTTKEVGEGTGLGLSICYGIIAEHNGRIWAESEPGKGATFIVELPIVTKSSQVKQAKPPEEKTQKVAKAKILAVDDEPMILQLVSRILAEEGYQVETADSAASALKMIDTGRYSLILLDIKMPDMDGIQLYKRLQKMAPSLAKRVMFITGDVMGPETEAFLSWTKAPYATKPFDAEQLKREIKRLLARGQ